MNTEQITISKTTAERALKTLAEWLEWVEDLDRETRADILALDELVKALGLEDKFDKELQEKREERNRVNLAYAKKIQAEQEQAGN